MEFIESAGVALTVAVLGLVFSNITFPTHSNLKRTRDNEASAAVDRLNSQILKHLRQRLATLRILSLFLCGLAIIVLKLLSGSKISDLIAVLDGPGIESLIWTSAFMVVLTLFSFLAPAHRRLTSVHNYFEYGRSSRKVHNVIGKAVSDQGALIPTLRGSQSEGLKSAVLDIFAAKHTDDRKALVEALQNADYDSSGFAKPGLGFVARSVIGVAGTFLLFVGIGSMA